MERAIICENSLVNSFKEISGHRKGGDMMSGLPFESFKSSGALKLPRSRANTLHVGNTARNIDRY